MNDLIAGELRIQDESRYPHLDLIYWKNFLSPDEASSMFHELKATVAWQSVSVKIFGRSRLQPRLTAWVADPSILYTYSGLTLPWNGWTPSLLDVKKRVEQRSQTSFNSVLINYYRDGNDSMGWHQDNEKELGVHPVIASLSMGGERLFKMKHVDVEEKSTIDFRLASGDLLVMRGDTQNFWKHSIPKTHKQVGERINLTWRTIFKHPSA